MTLDYWFMFPISTLIATMAMATGIEGATFFTPLFILALGLPPEVAIATGLITETFGFSSGLFAYFHRRIIDYRLGGALLVSTVPMALIGVWLAGRVEPDHLKVILGVILLGLAFNFLRDSNYDEAICTSSETHQNNSNLKGKTRLLVSSEGEEIRYNIPKTTEGQIIAGIGGLFIGMTSTGQGQFNGYFLLHRSRVPSKVAVATSVLVVVVTALTASIGHAVQIATGDLSQLNTIVNLTIFTVPGVVIGGQIGPMVACRLPHQALVKGMGIIFIIVGALMLAAVFL